MQTLNGFIKVHRKLVQWGWYQDYVVKDLFLHLLLTSSFKDSEWMGRTIRRGQLVTSYGNLANTLGFSVQQIRTAINKLKSTGEITTESTNRFTIITVVNWEKYQVLEIEVTNKTTSTATNEQQTSNIQATNEQQHLKNVKNIKNDNNVKKEAAADTVETNGYSLDENLNQTILNFIAFRKEKKASMTDTAVKLMIEKLDAMTTDNNEKIRILQQSIMNDWKDIYPLAKHQGDKGEGKKTKYPYGNNKFCNYKPGNYDFEEIERLERELNERNLQKNPVE